MQNIPFSPKPFQPSRPNPISFSFLSHGPKPLHRRPVRFPLLQHASRSSRPSTSPARGPLPFPQPSELPRVSQPNSAPSRHRQVGPTCRVFLPPRARLHRCRWASPAPLSAGGPPFKLGPLAGGHGIRSEPASQPPSTLPRDRTELGWNPSPGPACPRTPWARTPRCPRAHK